MTIELKRKIYSKAAEIAEANGALGPDLAAGQVALKQACALALHEALEDSKTLADLKAVAGVIVGLNDDLLAGLAELQRQV